MRSVFKSAWLKFPVGMTGLILLASITVSATTIVIPTDDEMIIGARAIVTGKVLSIESAWDESHDRIYTYVRLKVEEVLKSQIAERKVVLKELGGRVGGEGLTVWGSPEYKKGERVLVYLDTWGDGSLRTHQLLLGKFSVVKDEVTGHRFVVRDVEKEGVAVLPRANSEGLTADVGTDRMELNAYKELIGARLAVNWEKSEQFQLRYYANTPMLASPGDYEGGSEPEYEPQWAYISSSHPRWFQPDSGQPVTFKVNPDQAPNSQIFDDVIAAMSAWSNVPGCALRLASGGTTSSCQPSQNENVILFNGCDGRWSPGGGCSGILAFGGLSWSGNSRVINGVTFLQALAGFVSFNPYASCYFTNHCNVQEVATHELGHAMGLGHSADTSATMSAYAHFDGRCASIRPDDAAGITFIYPDSGGGGGPLTVVTSSLPGGTAGTSYSQMLTASGGTPSYSWSVIGGGLPGGLSLATNGAISGTPNSAGTFNFTIQVRDQAQATATKALSINVVSGGSQFDSQFVAQTVPASVTPGQTFISTLTWLNTGTATWSGSSGLRLISQNPLNNVTWGGNSVLLTTFNVPPGQQLSVSFQATAPTTPGSYNFQWIVGSGPTSPFGQPSTNVVVQVGSGGGGIDGSTFATQTVPTAMTAGQSYNVSVTMQNSGTTTWSAGTYKLGSQNPQDSTTWGLNRVNLAAPVAPGASATFNFGVTAPAVAGSYNFQWQMFNGSAFYGARSANVVVVVSAGGGGPYGAVFISQNVPASMNPGQTYSVSVTMRNSGTQSWSSTGGISLSSQNPAGNSTWGKSRVNLTKLVGAGSQFAFTFSITAPSAAGLYNFQWQMKRDASGYFGLPTTNVTVQVGTSGGVDGAVFVSQTVPTSMTAGQTVGASITMRNSGTSTWQPGTHSLGSLKPTGNTTWGLSQASLASTVAPGSNATFSFNVTAPLAAGTHNFQWGMKRASSYFGAATINVAVTVSGSGGVLPTTHSLFRKLFLLR